MAIDPEPPDESYMQGRCHIIKYKHQWTTFWSIECHKQLISYKTMNFIAHNNITLQLATLRELLEEIKTRKIERIGITIDKDPHWALSRCVNFDKLLNDTIQGIKDSGIEINFYLGDPKNTRKFTNKLKIPRGIIHAQFFRQDHVNDLLLKKMKAKWRDEWAACPEYGKHTRKWLPKANPCEIIKTWDKRNIGLIIRLVTGHGPFRYHIAKCEQDPEYDATCDLCDEDEQTVNHLILECPEPVISDENNTDFWSVIMNVSLTDTVTDTKMEGGTTGLCS